VESNHLDAWRAATAPRFYTMAAMRRRLTSLILSSLAALLVLAPSALAHDGGEGWYGETNDKVVTNAGFILIVAFPLIIFVFSMLQWHLEKRKNARKKAAKARKGSARWQGGW
jgi:hypothetical protein